MQALQKPLLFIKKCLLLPAESQQVEYVYNIDAGSGTVLVQDGGEVVYTEEPMDVPGATVEIVETTVTPTSGQKHSRRKGTPAYREQLLFR